MANNEFFVQRPAVTPTIYVYNLPQVTTHKGYVKVGYTDRDAVTRINDPACKTGVFLREIAKRLITGLEPPMKAEMRTI